MYWSNGLPALARSCPMHWLPWLSGGGTVMHPWEPGFGVQGIATLAVSTCPIRKHSGPRSLSVRSCGHAVALLHEPGGHHSNFSSASKFNAMRSFGLVFSFGATESQIESLETILQQVQYPGISLHGDGGVRCNRGTSSSIPTRSVGRGWRPGSQYLSARSSKLSLQMAFAVVLKITASDCKESVVLATAWQS